MIIFVIVTTIAWFVLTRTVSGRYVYSAGSNPEAARLAGVPVAVVTTAVYVISGVLAAVGGVLLTSRLAAGVPTSGKGSSCRPSPPASSAGPACPVPAAARSAPCAVR